MLCESLGGRSPGSSTSTNDREYEPFGLELFGSDVRTVGQCRGEVKATGRVYRFYMALPESES